MSDLFGVALYRLEKFYISQVNHIKAVNLTLNKHTNKVESNFINRGIASLDSCKNWLSQYFICKLIARGAPRLLSRSPGAPYGAL